jgi:uncharacterized protein YigE (DUF2233 family)
MVSGRLPGSGCSSETFSKTPIVQTFAARNGGIFQRKLSGPNEVYFVITKGGVSFYEFARFFRDRRGCTNALFLDGGEAPGLYAPALGRNDAPGHGGAGMGQLSR